ncbi:MAG: hypothetical protein V3V08_11035 [Nannocystaceae bacterium]
MRDVVTNLPDEASLGELIDAARKNPHLEPVLDRMTVQELIDMARLRRPPAPAEEVPTGGVRLDADGNPIMDLPDAGPAVIRRRADVPDGDLLILRCLSTDGPVAETPLSRKVGVTTEQLRLTIRQLLDKRHIHIEGTGPKRKFRITRSGGSYLRKRQ